MSVAKIGKRGTLVIPSEIRKQSKIKEGDELLIDISEAGLFILFIGQ